MGSRGSSSGISRSNNVLGHKAYNTMPKGWIYTVGATTAPFGYAWANNGKSRFSSDYQSALVRDEASHFRPVYANKDWAVAKDRVDGSYKIQTTQIGAGLTRVFTVEKQNGNVIAKGADVDKIPQSVIDAIKNN